ncbi:MAG: ABC transporter transmembrane domain-containing protein [Geminicoccaceae bacterium]|nr:ABC transporter transmembrane domain-containing protein [Geminicoccaceae bacterium]
MRQTSGGEGGQAPRAGCRGLEALVLAARLLGVHLAAEELAREAPDAGAAGPEELARLARAHGLDAALLQLSAEDLERVEPGLPVLLALRDGSWRLIEGLERQADVPILVLVDPSDPARARERVDPLTFEEGWTGRALVLRRSAAARELDRPFGMGWMLTRLLEERRLFAEVALASMVGGFLALAPPLFFMVIVDRVLVHQRPSTLFVLLVWIAVVLLFEAALGFQRRLLVAHAAARIDARIGLHLFDRLIGLPIDFFERRSTGEIVHKLAEVRRVRSFLTGQLLGCCSIPARSSCSSRPCSS